MQFGISHIFDRKNRKQNFIDNIHRLTHHKTYGNVNS